MGLIEFIGAIFARLMADEVKAWLPAIIDRLIDRSVERLPDSERERYSEEWRSVVNDTPGDLNKLRVAIGFIAASSAIARSSKSLEGDLSVPLSHRALACVIMILVAPVLCLTAIFLKIESRQAPILAREKRVLSNGREIFVLIFRTSDTDTSELRALRDRQPVRPNISRFLKRHPLHQLPTLVNVMRGEVQLVKPGQNLFQALLEFIQTTG